MTEIEVLATQLWVYEELESGRAEALIRAFHLKNPTIAKAIGVSTPSVWSYFNKGRRPRRAVALRLAQLLEELQVAKASRRA